MNAWKYISRQSTKRSIRKIATDAERLLKDAAFRLLSEEGRFRAAAGEGIAQAERGEYIEETEMVLHS